MLSAVIAALAAVVGALPVPLPPVPSDPTLASFTPYPAVAPLVRTVPEGYRAVFTESLDRHGSRALATRTYATLTLGRLEQAKAADALTRRGRELADEVDQLLKDTSKVGLGELSERGKAELEGIGARVGLRLPGLLTKGTTAELWSSGIPRATDSATSFRRGLASTAPRARLTDVEVDARQLRFDKTDPAYAQFLADDVAATRAIDRLASTPRVQAAARSVLERSFTPAFVSSMSDPARAALDLWNLYAIVPGMGDQTSADFSAFLGRRDAAVLAELDDADYFFRIGPSFAGQDTTYAAARVVLDDFLARLHERLRGSDVAAVFRFGHAEQLIPFTALLGIEGSDRQQPPGTVLTRADNPWRGGVVAPLGGNVQWDVFRDRHGRVLVRVLQDERQVRVSSRCRQADGAPLYYRLDELERCLRDR